MAYTKEQQEVLDKYNLDSFRNVGTDQFMSLANDLSKMDKQVALSIIQQIPNYLTLASEAMNKEYSLIESLLQDSKEESKQILEAYQSIIDVLNERANDPTLTPNDLLNITDQTIRIAELMDKRKDKDDKLAEFFAKLFSGLLIGILAIFAAILGVNINAKKNNDAPNSDID